MNVEQVIAVAKEWVDAEASRMPGFCGAHLMGGVTYTPRQSTFPAYRDVDMSIILEGKQELGVHDVAYRGLILEYGEHGVERYAQPPTVLADPELASNLVADSILADPHGMLAPLQAAVRQEYARRKWVLARCDAGAAGAQRYLAAVGQQQTLAGFQVCLVNFLLGMTEQCASATLAPPTHRRCLVVMRQALEGYGESALAERVLALIGFAHLTPAAVAGYLHECMVTFDRAVQIVRSPVIYKFKLQPHVRPYVVEGSQEMIDQGFHREAMYWIWTNLAVANNAIQTDGDDADKRIYQAKLDCLLEDMGWRDPAARAPKLAAAQQLAAEVAAAARRIVDCHPQIAA
ncbi:MAG: hypothetical protein U0X20_33605 [Caldilineaceae bacterium]